MQIHPITQRFIDIYNYLIREDYLKDKATFLKRTGIKEEDLNAILAGKKDISLQNLLTITKLGINPAYLILGEGNIGWTEQYSGRPIMSRLSTKDVADIINLDVVSEKDKEIIKLIDNDIKIMIEYLIQKENIENKWDFFYHLVLLYDNWYKNSKKIEEEESSKEDFKNSIISKYEKVTQDLEKDIEIIQTVLNKRLRQFAKLKGEYDKLL